MSIAQVAPSRGVAVSGRITRIGLAMVGAVLVVAVPYLIPTQMSLLVTVGIFYLACIGLTPLIGQAGQVSLGQTLFMAIGAYGAGLLTLRWNWPTVLAAIVLALFCGGLALLFGAVFLRLRGYYFALATLGLAVATASLSTAWIAVTGGPSGMVDIPSLNLFGYEVFSDQANFYLLAVLGGLAAWITTNLRNSQTGRALAAVGNDAIAAGMLGINGSRYKATAFAISAVTASLAGSLYAFYLRFFSPEIITVTVAFSIVIMVAIGGSRSAFGPLIGAIVIQGVPQMGQTFSIWVPLLAGLVLIVVMTYFPAGLWGAISNAARGLRRSVPADLKEQ
ncbi:branched-chain amino acid ABC transporter permease [Nocardioides sp. NPDC058538]|uniref:branched-chain amino acid ABC transporter permease n=1 Tax=Nocardioides sp. NPDC058538 TaxID=3346542 RepID=UPI003647FBE4